jgi:phytoene dehydrogenase-like protein
MDRAHHVIVVGAGLAGLTAAATLARAGARVTVLEKSSAIGGRAATQEKAGFAWNLGPHALYAAGAGKRILEGLGVPIRGRVPPVSGYAYDGDVLHTLPGGFVSLLTTGLLSLGGRLAVARLLGSFARIDPGPLAHTSASAWIDAQVRAPEVRRLVAGLFRVSSYAADLDRLSAGVAISQLQLALAKGVLYLDGGWGTLVEGLADVARQGGATIRAGVGLASLDLGADGVRAAVLSDGARIDADAVVIAASPSVARGLVPGSQALARFAERAVPIHAACLDVALSTLPEPRNTFALGLDVPLYFSVHSTTARLAPEGGAVIHVAEYLATSKKGDAAPLEALLGRMQPGYRDVLVERRFLPHLTVSHALPLAEDGGFAGRPDVDAAGAPGVFLAGDWVGPEGMIADGSFASGERAAKAILARSSLARAA